MFNIISGDVVQFLVLVNLVSDPLLVLLSPALDAGAGVGGDDDGRGKVWFLSEGCRRTFGRLVAFNWTPDLGRRRSVENSASRENSALGGEMFTIHDKIEEKKL